MPAAGQSIVAEAEAIAHRRREVATLHIQKFTSVAIAETLQWDRQTIDGDVKWLKDMWRRELIDDPVEVKAQEIAELVDMERECVRMTRTEPLRKGAWMDRRLRIKERIHRLLGLDAPTKIDANINTKPSMAEVAHLWYERNGHSLN